MRSSENDALQDEGDGKAACPSRELALQVSAKDQFLAKSRCSCEADKRSLFDGCMRQDIFKCLVRRASEKVPEDAENNIGEHEICEGQANVSQDGSPASGEFAQQAEQALSLHAATKDDPADHGPLRCCSDEISDEPVVGVRAVRSGAHCYHDCECGEKYCRVPHRKSGYPAVRDRNCGVHSFSFQGGLNKPLVELLARGYLTSPARWMRSTSFE